MTDGPLIVQGDFSLLLETHHPRFAEARDRLSAFAELEKSPEYVHTYRITPLSLWNAASAGLGFRDLARTLETYSRYPLPPGLLDQVREWMDRYGQIELWPDPSSAAAALLVPLSDRARQAVAECPGLGKHLTPWEKGFRVAVVDRGTVKALLIRHGWPVRDLAPLREGAPLPLERRFEPRPYQIEAADALLGDGGPGTGYGVVVLPCGSGKTMVGLELMCRLRTHTLILAPNVAAVHQWRDEILDKTDAASDLVGEYTGERKEVRPITLATYQVLVWRPDKGGDFPHFSLLRGHPWGLILYDEVHLLPAPVFRVVGEVQAVRRVGLTATLVREDGNEDFVFTLVGPKRYDRPWKELERLGWIARAVCREIRVPAPPQLRASLAIAQSREAFRLASENPNKIRVVQQLVANHPEDHILVIGQYLGQLERIAEELRAPLVTGKTPNAERERLYRQFREGRLRVLVVSKVANFALDLPDAGVAIQVSGTFGSRQEEAQRLGRILRPKARDAVFYSLVTRHSVEEDYARQRQRFLTEQGYAYHLEIWEDDELALLS